MQQPLVLGLGSQYEQYRHGHRSLIDQSVGSYLTGNYERHLTKQPHVCFKGLDVIALPWKKPEVASGTG